MTKLPRWMSRYLSLHNKEQEINEKVRAAERQIERQIGDLETLLRETTWQQNHLLDLEQEQAQITERLGDSTMSAKKPS